MKKTKPNKTRKRKGKRCECQSKADVCGAVSKNYFCTRIDGHKGDHVACGGVGIHRLHTWPQRPKPTSAVLYGSRKRLTAHHHPVHSEGKPEYYVRMELFYGYSADEVLARTKALPGEIVLNSVDLE